MIYRGLLISAASGKIDGIIASHNRGGQYFKAHVIPTDPNTHRQQTMRDAMLTALFQWQGMDAADRTTWDAWAKGVRRKNRLGDEHTPTGYTEFLRATLPRIQAVAEFAAPITYAGPGPTGPEAKLVTPPTGEVTGSNADLTVEYAVPDFWTADPEAILLLYTSAPQAATRRWFRGPYQLRAFIVGDSSSPPAADLTAPLITAATAGQRVYWRLRVSTPSRGLSAPYEGMAIAP